MIVHTGKHFVNMIFTVYKWFYGPLFLTSHILQSDSESFVAQTTSFIHAWIFPISAALICYAVQ